MELWQAKLIESDDLEAVLLKNHGYTAGYTWGQIS